MRKFPEEKVSIIIVTYNTLNYVAKCVESVLTNTDPKHEIIIVDNASEKPTRDYLISIQKHPNIKLILNTENRLWSPANNQGLKASDENSRFCLLLNSDVEVFKPNWLEALRKPMLQYKNVGITGTQYNFVPVKPTYGAIDGCCFMIRKIVLDEIGLLDERFPWNGAGAIFTYNAWARGWYYYHVDDPGLLIHYGKRSRMSNQLQLKNQRIERFKELQQAGLKPEYDLLAYIQNAFNTFKINNKIRPYLIPS